MAKNNTLLYVGLAVGAGILLTSKNALSSVTNTGSALLPGGAVDRTPIDAAGTIKADVVNGSSSYATEVANHPDLLNPNYQLTPAQCSQYLANYLDLRQALPGWVNTTEDGVMIPTINAACQHHWTMYGAGQHYTYYALAPASLRPFQPAPAAPSNGSSGGFWSGLLNAVTTVAPIIFGTPGSVYPQLGDAEIEILISGCAFVSNITPMFQEVDPDWAESVDQKMYNLVEYYG